MPTLRGNDFGFDYALVWRVGSNGIATGQLDPNALGSAPVTSHAYFIRGGISCNLPLPSFGTFDFRGNGAYEGSVDAGLESLANGEMSVSQCDATLAVLLAGGSLDTTTITGGPTIWSPNQLHPTPRQVGLALIRKRQSQITATAGQIYYQTVLYPKVQMRLVQGNFSQDTGLNTSPVTLSIKPQIGTRFPWGEAFGTNQDWYNNSNIQFSIESDYPWAMTSFVQDNSETTYTLQYLPVYSTVTAGRANAVYAVGGVPTAPTSVVVGTGVVTLAAAGTANVVDVGFYQTEYLTA
jgi:hypothetical protein